MLSGGLFFRRMAARALRSVILRDRRNDVGGLESGGAAVKQRTDRLRLIARIVSVTLIVLLLMALLLFRYIHPRKASQLSVQSLDALCAGQQLQVGSRWVGVLRISEHSGEGRLQDGMRRVRGYIDRDEQGCFFELYDWEDSVRPLLSLNVALEGGTMFPQIGEHDALYFYIWLDSRDALLFRMELENGKIYHRYVYNDGRERAVIEFSIRPEDAEP